MCVGVGVCGGVGLSNSIESRVLMCNSVIFNLVHLRNDSQLFMEEFAPLINVVEGLTFWTHIPEKV